MERADAQELRVMGGGNEPGWLIADASSIAPTDANLLCEPKSATWTPKASGQEQLAMDDVTWTEAYTLTGACIPRKRSRRKPASASATAAIFHPLEQPSSELRVGGDSIGPTLMLQPLAAIAPL
jgi:hypothetical protein